ncbi:uncharacterized protein PRCAT00002845001 [Priceomyces carsonii]|uniref:uncharacterized protein n=1 Tax=Priceomyces carsonii TaxID=28549 RepID=UPI002ED85F1E|nr:unnamed protein product [Priceomyces carsonii]
MNFIDSVDIRSPLISFKGKNFEPASINRERSDSSVNLVLCLDGTENEFGLKPYTNVLKLFRMLDKDTATQLCYYQPGVGAKFKAESTDIREPNFFQSKLSKIGNKFDAMFAFTLERHVLAAYTFLMKFYQKGDKIYIIGFRQVILFEICMKTPLTIISAVEVSQVEF